MALDVVRSVRFVNDGNLLRGVVHLPDTGERKFPAVLLCHGLTGHRIEAHRLFVKTSQALSAAGIASMRFDFRGSGESEGDFTKMTASGEVSDALAATAKLARQSKIDKDRMGILGLSLGGLVTAMVLGRTEQYKSAALWSAAIRSIWHERLKPAEIAVWRRAGVLNMGGMDVGIQFLDDIDRLEPLIEIVKSKADVFIAHGSADTTTPVKNGEEYAAALRTRPAGRTELLVVPDADHTFSRRDWERTVIDRTVQWFRETL